MYSLSNYFGWLQNRIIVLVICCCLINHFKAWQPNTISSYFYLWFFRLTEHIRKVLTWGLQMATVKCRLRMYLSEGSRGVYIQDNSHGLASVFSRCSGFRVTRIVTWLLASPRVNVPTGETVEATTPITD